MGRVPALHAADELLKPALDRAIAATEPPDADAPLVALAMTLAGTLDRMSRAERRAMLGQTAPQLLRGLVELDRRAARRVKPVKRPPSRLDEMRSARAASDARRGWRM